jgi:hypothetical protein
MILWPKGTTVGAVDTGAGNTVEAMEAAAADLEAAAAMAVETAAGVAADSEEAIEAGRIRLDALEYMVS